MARTADEIEKLIAEWEALRAEYASRGATGIVDFIGAELRKLHVERDMIVPLAEPRPPA